MTVAKLERGLDYVATEQERKDDSWEYRFFGVEKKYTKTVITKTKGPTDDEVRSGIIKVIDDVGDVLKNVFGHMPESELNGGKDPYVYFQLDGIKTGTNVKTLEEFWSLKTLGKLNTVPENWDIALQKNNIRIHVSYSSNGETLSEIEVGKRKVEGQRKKIPVIEVLREEKPTVMICIEPNIYNKNEDAIRQLPEVYKKILAGLQGKGFELKKVEDY